MVTANARTCPICGRRIIWQPNDGKSGTLMRGWLNPTMDVHECSLKANFPWKGGLPE